MNLILPEWIDGEAWDAFVEMRQRIKKPLTERGKVLAIMRLDKLRKEGHDASEVLDQSTFMDWAGLWPLHENTRTNLTKEKPNGRQLKTFDAIRREASASAIARTSRAYQQMGSNLFGALPPGNKRTRDGDVH